ncbi:MAG: putative HNHc nuclease [Clostridiales bacterium]|nr:putative HNHc nuclease [Clostridiales bacterium]
MITTAKIINYDSQKLVLAPTNSLGREILQKQIETVEIRLNDGRTISAEQRRKIFALIRDIALWNGDEPETLRMFLTWDFCCKNECEYFSLSNVDMTTAKEFINYLINFCFEWSVPTKDTLLNQTDDIGKYLYCCLEHRKCAICNEKADIHHIDRIGMGGNRNRVNHVGLRAIALCRKHHNMAHQHEKELFAKYHIYGIKLDGYLCKVLHLHAKGGERNEKSKRTDN